MTENQLSSQLVAQLKLAFRGSVVFKHADRATIGIPDITCTWQRKTVWIEDKYLRPKDLRQFPAIDVAAFFLGNESSVQLENMRRLSRQAHRAFYLMYTKDLVIVADPEFIWDHAMHRTNPVVNEYAGWKEAADSQDQLFSFPKNDKAVLELIHFYFQEKR